MKDKDYQQLEPRDKQLDYMPMEKTYKIEKLGHTFRNPTYVEKDGVSNADWKETTLTFPFSVMIDKLNEIIDVVNSEALSDKEVCRHNLKIGTCFDCDVKDKEEPKQIKLTLGKYALVDSKDFEELNKYKWTARKHGNTFYAVRNSRRINGKQGKIHMHRLIMNTPDGMVTDHIDGNGLNNQRKNLRICTHTENMANRKIHINNTSGYKGVTWSKQNNRWRSQIYLDSKNIFLGLFTDKEEAYKAYIKACKKYHKEFANYKQPTNKK